MPVASGPFMASFVKSVYDHRQVPSDPRPAVAFAGRSNVGKSTLINTITTGKKIAKVSQTPGKTQALNFFMVENRFYMVDLPGYGFAKVPPQVKKDWAVLVENYLTGDPNLRGLVFLLDCRREINDDDTTLLQWVVNRGLPFLMILTKTDKLSRNQLGQAVMKMKHKIFGDEENAPLIPFSSKTGVGKKEVIKWVRNLTA